VSSRPPRRDPERLIDGELGSLLREANREFSTELDQPAAFRRVTERLAASREHRWPRAARWLVPATPIVAAALAAVFVLAHRAKSDAAPELVAENWRPRAEPHAEPLAAATDPASRADESPPQREDPKREPRGASARASTKAVSVPEPSARPGELSPTPAPQPPAPSADEDSKAPDCLSFARQGQTREAEACFLVRAKGSGLAAEMALYEVARLRRDVLADADGALRALAEYRERFPAGSLRREADMSQLELLLQLGRSADALKQSDELLSSSASGERAAELRLLRGHILRKQSRYAEAAREYELAEGARARGEATYFRALCLEALGRAPEAAAAFSRYLEQPQRPYAEDARRRLEKLQP
jgi:Tetratricopeptide repeat